MSEEDQHQVLERLRELEGWSEYITEALHLNRSSEPVKREMLERAVDPQTLRQIRERRGRSGTSCTWSTPS